MRVITRAHTTHEIYTCDLRCWLKTSVPHAIGNCVCGHRSWLNLDYRALHNTPQSRFDVGDFAFRSSSLYSIYVTQITISPQQQGDQRHLCGSTRLFARTSLPKTLLAIQFYWSLLLLLLLLFVVADLSTTIVSSKSMVCAHAHHSPARVLTSISHKKNNNKYNKKVSTSMHGCCWFGTLTQRTL